MTSFEGVYRRDPNLERMLRGKRVAIVGPAPHLVGSEAGDMIDSYDIVCRVNQDAPIPPDLFKDYGRRMDILITCANTDGRLRLQQQYDVDADYLRDMKYVICAQGSVENNGTRVDLAFQEMNKYNTPFHIIGDSFAEHIDKVVGCETNTGFNGIVTLLRYPIRELYVTGFSFYNMGGGGKVWYDEAFDERVRAGMIEDDPEKIFGDPSHPQQQQINCFVKLLDRYPNILTVDSYLQNNLLGGCKGGGGLKNIPTALRDRCGATENVSGTPVGGGITIFAMPKSFRGHLDVIQRNALGSWLSIEPKPEIILLGNDDGVCEVASELGLVHVPDVRCNSFGTPLVSDIFAKAQLHSSNEIMMYINSDMILLSDFMPAVQQVTGHFDNFLVTGQRWDADITEPLNFDDPAWEEKLRQYVLKDAFLHWPTGMDYFLFKRGLWPEIPDFAIGRMAWDSWLVGKQVDDANVVIDATEMVMAIHQDHQCGTDNARCQEITLNRQFAGAVLPFGSTSCAAWKLTSQGVIPRHAGDFLKSDDPTVLFTCLDRAHRQNPTIIKKQFEHFMRCAYAGRLNNLLRDAKMHLLSEPDNIAAKLVIGFAGEKDTELAIELFNRGLESLRAGNAAQAVEYLNRVLSYSVEMPNLHYVLAIAFTQLGDLPAAAKACAAELAAYPQNHAAQKLSERLAGAGRMVMNRRPQGSAQTSRF